MTGIASLLGALLIALVVQRHLWDDHANDDSLYRQSHIFLTFVAMAASIIVVAGALIRGDTELTQWEMVVVAASLGPALLLLLGGLLVQQARSIGSTIEARVPLRVRPAMPWVWRVSGYVALVAFFAYMVVVSE